MNHRSGFLLIIVAGIMVLLATTILLVISHTRSDAEDVDLTMREVQARIALTAALQYIQETSRIGWELDSAAWSTAYAAEIGLAINPSSAFVEQPWLHPGYMPATNSTPIPYPNDPRNELHEEAFGWVDVRDGGIGPKTLDYDGDGEYDLLYDPAARVRLFDVDFPVDASTEGVDQTPVFPNVGGVCIEPLHALTLPPYATATLAAPNSIEQDPSDPLFGLPLLRNPDPSPLGSAGTAPSWTEHQLGNEAPVMTSLGRAWMRLYRDGPATFVITVGAGGTMGFKNWAEVVAHGASGTFGGSREMFEDSKASEVRMWYRAEWSPAVGGNDVWRLLNQQGYGDSWRDSPMWSNNLGGKEKTSLNHATWNWQYWGPSEDKLKARDESRSIDPRPVTVNQGGTFTFIQRLRFPPARW
ncbi:MAG: hypothetical protein PF961_01710 [Planctomycetota bacterium]|jgi:hypothetical protein|nr:hypothetical protein [Planctomycetota bacterium]